MKKLTGITIGALLIAVGVLCGLSIFGIGEVNVSLDGWWALFIIAPAFGGLLTGKDKIGSAIALCFGILLLLAARDVIGYDMLWKTIVPIIIVGLGVKLIAKAVSSREEEQDEESADSECAAAFRAETADYTDTEIEVAKVSAVFGGANCNFSDAKIKDGSKIDLLCVFGGADIIVPENVKLKVNVFCLFGGIEDKRAVKNTDKEAPTLQINGFCMFGGADIK